MTFDFPLTLAAFGIGIVVGLTGTGGGALMTGLAQHHRADGAWECVGTWSLELGI